MSADSENVNFNESENIIIKQLREKINYLSKCLTEKNNQISILTQLISCNKRDINTEDKQAVPITTENINLKIDDESTWEVVKRKKHPNYNNQSSINHRNKINTVSIQNRFNGMLLDIVVPNNEDYRDEIITDITNNKVLNVSDERKRPNVVINRYHHNDILIKRKNVVERTLPGNSTYADVAKQGEKMIIVGDSICRPIDMFEFEERLDKGTSRKRFYRGATASQIFYYIEAVLKEDIPDKVILCVGTNNLTKKRQTELETAKEIIDIVDKCYASGVNDEI